jgi:hypothetical protein
VKVTIHMIEAAIAIFREEMGEQNAEVEIFDDGVVMIGPLMFRAEDFVEMEKQ